MANIGDVMNVRAEDYQPCSHRLIAAKGLAEQEKILEFRSNGCV